METRRGSADFCGGFESETKKRIEKINGKNS